MIFEWGHNLRFYIYALIGTTDEILWLFPDFDSKLQISLTCNKIPWLFPDSEKDWNYPDFPLTVATLLEDIGQGQMLGMTQPLMPVIICAK